MTSAAAEELFGTAPVRKDGFRWGLCAATIVLTGMGLLLAAGNVSWTDQSDALNDVWVYVNVALGAAWLVAWPAAALANGFALPRRPTRIAVLLEFATILMGATPAMGVAGAVAWPGWQTVAQSIAVQGAVALLAMGVLTWRARSFGGLLGVLLAVLALGLPIAGYVSAEFYPAAGESWRAFVPLAAVARAASGEATEMFRWVVGIFAVVGGALWSWGPGDDDQP
jgi:hypothetical protein